MKLLHVAIRGYKNLVDTTVDCQNAYFSITVLLGRVQRI